MKKKNYTKIPISEFISDKELSKIEKIIDTSESVDIAYDRIESLLSDDFTVKGLGTNRLILIHKKKKFKDLIFKVAGDSHGVEANYREFYNGDLDHCLTFSYSISSNGVFIVQERVQDFDSKMMKEYKKDVRKMLKHLSSKLLLVDCRISNFKNFGIRKNGDVVLLDHGDTVPLENSQGSKIVNINEESNVSLKCKRFKDTGAPKLKPCGGKLEYSKDYDYLVCTRCGAVMSVNEAYKEFYGDTKVRANVHSDFIDGLNFDPKEWAKEVKKYAQDKMMTVNNKTDNKEGECEMKEKIINGKKCKQLKGYWIPEAYLTNPIYAMLVNSVKTNKVKPKDFLKNIGLDPSEYTVKLEDHTPNEERSKWKEKVYIAVNEVFKIINEHVGQNERSFDITYKEIEARCGFIIDSIEKEKAIVSRVITRNDIKSMRYKPDHFYIEMQTDEEQMPEYTYDFTAKNDDVKEDDDSTQLTDIHAFDECLGIVRNNEDDVVEDEEGDEYIDDEGDDDIEYDDNDDDETYEEVDDVANNNVGLPYDLNDDTGYNVKYLRNNYDFTAIRQQIEHILSTTPLSSIAGYDCKIVNANDIASIFESFNNVYGGIFDGVLYDYDDGDEEHIDMWRMCKFIENVIGIDGYKYIDINVMKTPTFKTPTFYFMIDTDAEVSDADDADAMDYDDYNSDAESESDDFEESESEDTNVISDEQSNDEKNEEESEMDNARVAELEQRISAMELKIKTILDLMTVMANDDKSDDDSDDDSNDSDEDDQIEQPVQISDDGTLLTINLDELKDNIQVIFNKDDVMYRLNPRILTGNGDFEAGLYDIVRAALKRFGNN